jgi:hypothetical protein
MGEEWEADKKMFQARASTMPETSSPGLGKVFNLELPQLRKRLGSVKRCKRRAAKRAPVTEHPRLTRVASRRILSAPLQTTGLDLQ